MKTEKEILDGINKVAPNLQYTLNTLKGEIDNRKWTDAQETLFTLLVNVAALEAAERILS